MGGRGAQSGEGGTKLEGYLHSLKSLTNTRANKKRILRETR